MNDRMKILVITPIGHIPGVRDILESAGEVTFLDDPLSSEVMEIIQDYHIIYTNPNKSKVFISREIIDTGKNLQVICTASTGTNHIDKVHAKNKGVPIISLTEEREVINKISSTAEHAFALMMSALRRIPKSFESVKNGQWDYIPFIGRQLDYLTIGIVGYGRLGSMFAGYCKAFGSKIVVYDPYKDVAGEIYEQVNLNDLLEKSDVISLHVHVNEETTKMVNVSWFEKMKSDVLLVNTSRGEIVNELDLVKYLKSNPGSCYATDVLDKEIKNKVENPVINYAKQNGNVIITPHIGGMTREAQSIAYGHAANLLKDYIDEKSN